MQKVLLIFFRLKKVVLQLKNLLKFLQVHFSLYCVVNFPSGGTLALLGASAEHPLTFLTVDTPILSVASGDSHFLALTGVLICICMSFVCS